MARTPTKAEDVVTHVKLALFWPATGAPFTDAEILTVADRKLAAEIYPAIADAREHCLTAIHDFDLLAGSTRDAPFIYSVPTESMAQIESVSYLDPQGHETTLEEFSEREWLKYERSASYASDPRGFAFHGANLRVFPHPPSVETGDRIRIRYVPRPLALVVESSTEFYRQLTAHPTYDGTSVVYTLDQTIVGTDWYDEGGFDEEIIILSAAAPHVPIEYLNGADDPGIASALTVTFTASSFWHRGDTSKNPSRAQAGDYMVVRYQSPILQLPHEAFHTLVMGVAAELAAARNDREQAKRRGDQYATLLEALPTKLSPRAISQPQTYVNRQSPTRLRMRAGLQRRWIR